MRVDKILTTLYERLEIEKSTIVKWYYYTRVSAMYAVISYYF